MSASQFLSTPGRIRRTLRAQGAVAWRLGIVLILIVSMVGMQPVSAEPAGTALQFDGTNDYVTFGTATNLGAQVFTLETWFKRTGTGATTSTGTGGLAAAIPLVTKGRGEAENSNVDMNYFFGIDSTGVLAADFEECARAQSGCPATTTNATQGGQNYPAKGSTAIQNNVWYHAAVTFDGRYWRFYLNGIQDGATIDTGATRFPRWDSIQHAGLGTAMNSTGVASGYFAGVLDETRIWNVVRTQAEIQASMNAELTAGTGLLGRWGLNEDTGTIATNSIAGNPNGTLTNGPLWVAGFPMPDLIPPAAPTALTATPRSAAVNLSWTAPPDLDIAGYNVYRSTAPSVPLTGPVNGTTLVTGTSYSDGGLSNGTPYYYVVTAVDTSANASAASNEVSATPLASLGAALRFDGVNDYVTFGPNLNAATFTLEAWIKREAGGATMTTGTDGLDGGGGRPLAYPVLTKGMGQGETPANINMNYFLGVTNTGVVGADFEDAATGGNHPAWGSTPIAVGEWHHIAATYNGSCWELYLDGSRETLNAAVAACPNAAPEATSIQHAGLAAGIGSTGQLSTGFFAGAIDEARVWNVARSQGEIQSTINTELTDGAGLIGRWGMNEGSGTTIADSTAPSANGTLTNGPTWTASAPFGILRPAAPTNLIVAPTSSDQIYLQWQDNANNETGFEIERSTDNGTTFAPVGAVGPDATVFDDGGLAATTAYCYRVYAESGGGASDFSNVACATTAATPGYGLDFGAGTAYVAFGDPDALDLPQFTIETWFRRTGAGTPNTTGTDGIAAAIPLVTHGAPQAEGSSVDANWMLVIDDANDVLAADFEDMASGANHPVYGVTAITNNVWHHAAATYDGTTWRLYLDGSLETTLAVNQAPRSDTTQRAALGAMIRTDDTPLGHFQGVLDEARVWNYARSQAEIQAAINDELTGAQPGLVARWGLNEGAGSAVNSSAGASIPGTITNSGYAWVAGAPFDLHNAAPNAPSLVAPADGAGSVAQPPALTVNVTDPEADDVTVTFYGRLKNAPPAPDFTLIAIPDPQYYASTYPAIYNAQMQWIVNNKTTRNIVYAASLGDNVDVSTNATQWDRAVAAYDILAAGGVPYGLVAGNHDGAPAGTAEFNARFATRKTVQASYGGRYGTSDYDNYYTLFEAGGMQFVAVFIEMDDGMTSASHPVLQWANSIMQMYSNRRAILVTHNLLNGGTATSFSAQGSAIFDALKGNANLFLMLGGHLDVARRRSDVGTNGNTIYSLRSDYQSVDSQQSGYLRIMRFSPSENLIYVSTYSPTQTKEYPNEVTENNFTLPYAMSSSGPFTVIGTASAAAGTNASVTWNGLADETAYEWYAVADDGNKQATSPIWSFTTATAQPACYTLTLSHTGSGSDPMADPSNSSGCPTGSYLAGATVSLSGAAPAAHWHIAGWSGTDADNSTATGNTLTMPAANHTVGVTYAQNEYTLTILSADGTVARDPNQATYHDGDTVALTATPAPGWSFTAWSGALTGSANPAALTIHGDATVTANYTRIRYPLSVTRTGTGIGYITSSPAGISCGTACSANYDQGTLVTLDAVSALGSTFSGWSGEGCTGTGACQVTMDGARSVVATFTLGTNVLSVSLAGTGGGSVSSQPAGIACGADCSEDYPYNTLVTLTATPDATSTFAGWNGAGCSGTGTCQVTMDAAKSVTATFTHITYQLTVLKLGAGNGTVSSSPPVINCGTTCAATLVKDSQITLAAAAANGSTFLGWAGSCSGTGACVVTMDSAKSVSASFALVQYTISGNAGQPGATLSYTGGSTTADGSGTYAFTVPAGWSGTVTPALAGYLFTPPSRSYTNLVADQPAQNYSAAPVIPPPSGLTCATLDPKPATASTGEKPQSKVWTHNGTWYAVFPTTAAGASSAGTWLWQLQGTVWSEVVKLSNRTDTKADVKVVGDLAHILLYADSNTQLVTAETSGGSYQLWTVRPAAVNLPLPNSEVATIDVDSTGKMWLATRTGAGEIVVYHSDSPYATWNGPVVLDTGAIGNDDIELVTALPNGTVGVLWSNQNTRRFGFRVHVDGANPATWSANELPAAGSAFDNVGAGMADDHLNVAVAADSTLYAAVKTGYDTAGYPKIALLVRRPNGVWDSLYGIDEAGTRPLILLDEARGTLTLIYTSSEGYNPIVYRQSTTQTIAFGSRATLRSGAFNDVSSMKANYSSEFVVLYSSSSEVAGQLCAPTPASGADLSITKSDGRTLVRPNDALVYTIVATNNGPQAVTGATVSDPLPAALANATWTCSGSGGATCPASGTGNIAATVNLPAGGAVTFRLTATVDLGARGTIENRASVAAPAGVGDPLPGNNEAVDLDTIVAGGVACDPAPGLVACWPMEENGGPALIDGSGNLNDAALYGAPAWVAGKVGSYALDLNGTSQYALAADDDTLDLTGQLSLIAWIRPEQYATQDIIKKATNGGINGYELSLATTKSDASTRKVFFRINQVSDGDTFRINSTTEYPTDGSWMHVAATFDGTTMRLYINSVLESSMELPAGTTIAANNLPVGIGAQSDGQRWLMGWLDEARIYNRALSLEEIQDLYGNRPPVAADNAYTTDEDTPLSVAAPGVLGNDTDANSDALTAVKVTDPAQGTLVLAADGSFTYAPAANFNGSDSFTYRANDGQADSNVATVRITIGAVNDAPTATAQSVTTAEETPLAITLAGSDIDGDPLTFTVATPPQNGTLSGTAPNLTYTPAANFNGSDSFTFVANDGSATSAPATFAINVTPVNDAPTAIAQSVTTAEDTPLAITLAGSDVDGDALTFAVVTPPQNGALSGTAPNLTYTPAANFNGSDSFTFAASDGTATSNIATVAINVTPVNDAPVASAQSVTTAEDTPLAITLAGSDIDGDPLTFAVVTGPANGTLSGTAPDLTYTPAAEFNGSDSFTFAASDGRATSNIATVAINVTPVNDAPVATVQSVATDEDTPLAITLAGSDIDGDALTFAVATPPQNGTLSGTAPNLTYTPAANFNGADSFAFQVDDGTATSAPATVAISVTPVNDAPVASAQSVTTAEDTPLAITLAGSDIDGDSITFAVATPPQNGTLSGTVPNLTYTPAANFNGSDSFAFQVDDGTAISAPATVAISVTPVNDAPVASAQSVTTAEDTPLAITLAGNDIDGDALSFAVATPPQNGTLSGTAPNLTYTPAANFNGSDSFTFAANDGTATSTPATVTIGVTPVNDAPVASAQSVTTGEDTPLAITLAGNDIDGDALTFAVVTPPQNGTLSGTAPNLTYTPAANYNGSDSFTFAANDGTATSTPATVTISVTPVNDAPVAAPDVYATDEDTPLTVAAPGVLGNDGDVDGDALSATKLTDPAHGTLSFNSDGSFTYAPDALFHGTDTFTYQAGDGSASSVVTTVSINVASINNAPACTDSTVSTAEDTAMSITLTCTDVDSNALGYVVVTPPQHGTLSGTAPNLTYTPAANFYGGDSFTYQASDGAATSNIATVTIGVTPVNDAPVATALSVTTAEDTPLAITLAGSDIDGDSLTFAVTTPPQNGTLSGTAPNLTYTPAANFNGGDSFTYQASDGAATSNIATVTIGVTPVNDAPIATAQSVTTAEETPIAVTLAGSDIDGDPLTFAIATPPQNGALSGTAPNLTYTPAAEFNGSDSFTFAASDGTATSNIATVAINVTPVNDTPVASAQSVTTAEDTPLAITLAGSDIDGDPLTFAVVTGPANGTLSGTAPDLTYTPAAEFNGSDSFTFAASDGRATSNIATVAINVTPVNDAPVATVQSVATDEDTPLAITLAGSDVDGDDLTFAVATPPQHGTLSGSAPDLTYTPAANFNGSDSFTFQVSDGAATSDVATIAISVTPVNDTPIATADVYATSEETLLTVAAPGVLANDGDLDGDELTVVGVSSTAHGTLTLATDGSFTYLPDAFFAGSDSFIYKAGDGLVTSLPVTVTINVHAVNHAPVCAAASLTTAEDNAAAISLACTDRDGDALDVTVIAVPAHGTLSGTAPELIYVPALNYHGADQVTFHASDGAAQSNVATIAITITPVNDAPQLEPIAVQDDVEGDRVEIAAIATDVDGDALHFTAVGLPAGVTIDPGSGVIAGQISAVTADATHSVTVTVDDGHGGQATQSFQWIVRDADDPGGQSGYPLFLPAIAR